MTLFPHPFDPRTAVLITQWLFLALLSASVLGVALVDTGSLLRLGTIGGLALVVVTTVIVSITRPLLTPAQGLFYVVPALDCLAIAILRMRMARRRSRHCSRSSCRPRGWARAGGCGASTSPSHWVRSRSRAIWSARPP